VASLLRMSGLLPNTLNIKPLLTQAKRQLREEADYLREADYLQRYASLLADAPEFLVPELHAELTTRSVLAMSFVGGVPVESMVDAPQEERDRIVALLVRLLFREIFEFQLVQTDPNFANYRYDTASRQLILLDFGATRPYKDTMVKGYRRLLTGAAVDDQQAVQKAALSLGYFDASTQEKHQAAVLGMVAIALEPFRLGGDYDFGRSDIGQRLHAAGMDLALGRDFWHIPPVDTLFLHRKLGGMYLLAARLKARVDVQRIAKDFISK
jgi:predicted unusual protein kinase regulating ubiquinone biosynthesis (AarF/ABC1/UbiB family)